MSTTTETITAETLAKKKELIQQLLAKAESTPYPEEAESFQAHAERLMVRYGIEAAQLDDSKDVKEEVTFEIITFKGSYELALQQGMGSFVLAYKTCTILVGGGAGKKLYIVGAKSDVEAMVVMVKSLEVQALAAMKVWWKGYHGREWMNGSQGWHARREFVLHFGYGAAARVREALKVAVSETPGSDLVLVNRQEVAKAAVNTLFGQTRKARGGMAARGGYDAQGAGFKAGQEATISTGKTIRN